MLWLTGGLRRAALGFAFLESGDRPHRAGPDYPPVTSFADVDRGLSAILDAEGVDWCDLAGQSHGGPLAQAFLLSPQPADWRSLRTPAAGGRRRRHDHYLAVVPASGGFCP